MAGRRRMKSVEQSIADTDEPTTRLRKDLTWWDLVVFGVSVVIGAGIFTVTASTAGDITGPAIWISFLIAAATCALAALCYAEFASTLPVAGSAYTFSYATFGEFLAWVIGWNLVLELAMGAAVVAKGWSSYLGTVFGFGNGTGHLGSLQLDWGALVIVTLVATLIALGTKLSSRFSAVVTAIKVSVVVLVVVVGAFYIRAANYSPFIPEPEVQHHGGGLDQSVFSLLTGAQGSHYGWYGVLAGASIVFFAFIGFDIVATMAEETKRPQRDVPRGILASLGVVTLLYVAVSVVLSGMVPYTQLRTVPGRGPANLATAFQANGVYWASGIISVGALAGLTTVVMVLMLGQCRVLFAMARDGLVPRQLAKTGSRGTPVRVTVLVAVLVATTASVFPITKLEEMVNVGTLFAFILVSAGVVVLRRTRPDLQRGFTAPWVPLLPIAAVCACLWLMLNLTALTWIRFGIWLVAGTAIYVGYGRRHSGVGINTAHEMGHKKDSLERWLSKITLAQTCYGHFYIEHNRGHHVRVSTPEDPASARFGETLWEFLPRSVIGGLRSAVHLEAQRLRRLGVSPWNPMTYLRNDVLNAWLMSVVLWGGLIAVFGPALIPFVIIQAVFGFSLLEAVNYLEHYGLLRQKSANGRYERCAPVHSWNSDHIVTNLFLYHLQRHSDHHANPTRRYQTLRSMAGAPNLPSGYASMISLTYFPPLWRKVMDHRVLEHYGGDITRVNLHPRVREKALARYGASA